MLLNLFYTKGGHNILVYTLQVNMDRSEAPYGYLEQQENRKHSGFLKGLHDF